LIIFIAGILGLLLVIFLMLVRNKKVKKISFRNLFRKKTQTILIILGSMIGTAMITGSLGINDSMSLFLYSQIKKELGPIDEIIYYGSSENYLTFNKEIGDEFSKKARSNYLIDGAINAYYLKGTISFNKTPIKNPLTDISVKIIAFDFGELNFFGIKNSVDSQVFFSKNLSEKLNTNGKRDIFISENAVSFFDLSKQKSQVTDYDVNELIPRFNFLSTEFENSFTVLMDINEFYRIFPEKTGKTNLIFISNTGDWIKGKSLTPNILSFFRNSDLFQKEFKINTIKANSINQVGNANIGYLFLFLSIFSIIAGVFLMISTYSMMAKEREAELGMLRAIGYYKSDIQKMFLFEGIFYSILSTAFGIFVGIGLTKFILSRITGFVINLSNRFLNALGSNFLSMTEIPEFEFYISRQNIIFSFSIGIFISLILVFFYSKKISEVEIVNAIRGIDEASAKNNKKNNLFRFFFIMLSAFFLYKGFQLNELTIFFLGAIIFTIAIVINYRQKKKFLFDILIIALLIITTMIDINIISQTVDALMFIFLKPLILLMGLSVLLMRNLTRIKWILSKKPFSKILDPFITKISFAYPKREKGKTHLIISVYSLVIFIIIIVTVIPHSQMIGIRQSKDTLFWGYDAFVPDLMNTNTTYKKELFETGMIENIQEIIGFNVDTDNGMQRAFLINSEFKFYELNGRWQPLSQYDNFSEAVEHLKQNENTYIVISGREDETSNTGSKTIELAGDYKKLGTYFFNNITFFQGIVVSDPNIPKSNDISKYDLIKIAGKRKDVIDRNYNAFKRFSEKNGIFMISTDDIVEISEIAIKGMIKILNAFLYFGMIIGIMGISITMYRAFYDRRKTIGMLKAIGFTKGQIFNSFLVETSIIVITGLLIGIVSGIISGEQINSVFSQIGAPGGQTLHIPWFDIILVSALFYLASIISVLVPSYNASKIEPAEALKTLE